MFLLFEGFLYLGDYRGTRWPSEKARKKAYFDVKAKLSGCLFSFELLLLPTAVAAQMIREVALNLKQMLR